MGEGRVRRGEMHSLFVIALLAWVVAIHSGLAGGPWLVRAPRSKWKAGGLRHSPPDTAI